MPSGVYIHLPRKYKIPRQRKLIAARWWPKVRVVHGKCWGWLGTTVTGGYGSLSIGRNKSPARAHRVAYELLRGPIPAGLNVLHSCDNPPCVNPSHLWLGTQSENIKDSVLKGRYTRTREFCRKGHALIPDNVLHRRDYRLCKTCRRSTEKRHNQKIRARKEMSNG